MAGLVDMLDPHVEQYLLRDSNEYIVYQVHKAWPASLWPAIRAAFAIILVPIAWLNSYVVFWMILIIAAVVGLQACYKILDDHRDRFVVTNQRVFRVHGIFSVQRATVPLGRILDITVKKPLLGRLLNYGHFVFESAAQIQGLSEIRYVKDIDQRDYELQQTMQSAGLRATATRIEPSQDDGT